MSRTRLLPALALILATVTVGCRVFKRSEGERPPLGDLAAATAVESVVILGDMAEAYLVRAPKLVFLDLPAWLLYEGPRDLILAVSCSRTRVEAAIASLGAEIGEEDRLAVIEELEELTGLSLGGAEAWKHWWESARERPASAWRGDLADACLADLESPDFLVRQDAAARLRALSGQDHGFDAKESAEVRAEAVARWRAWRATLGAPGGDG